MFAEKTIEVVESTQRGVVVRDLERLIVQHDRNVFLRHVDVPTISICPEHRCATADDARRTLTLIVS